MTNKRVLKADLKPIYAELYDKYYIYTEMGKVETGTYYYYLDGLYYCLEPVVGERAIISEEGVEYGNPPIEKIVYGYSHLVPSVDKGLHASNHDLRSQSRKEINFVFCKALD